VTRLCCFCDNQAADRRGVPLCGSCWSAIDRKVREEKSKPLIVGPHDPLALYGAHVAMQAAAREPVPAGTRIH
jgi:hypothetical protein